MNFKKEIEKELEFLKPLGHDRRMIEEKLGYARESIAQLLSKGGNQKLYKGILLYKEWVLKNSTPQTEASRATTSTAEVRLAKTKPLTFTGSATLDEISKIRESNDKLIEQQGVLLSQQTTLLETNKRLAEKVISIDSSSQTGTVSDPALETLIEFLVQIGKDAGTWKDSRTGFSVLRKKLSDKIRAAGVVRS